MNLRVIEALLSLLGLLIPSAVSLFILYKVNKAQRSVEEMIPSLDDFIEIGEDGTVNMDERLVKLIDGFGSRIAQSLRMSFLQGLGANAKIEKGLQGAMTADIIDKKMPIVNLIGDIFGIETTKYITKHPNAIGQLVSMAGPMLPKFLQGMMKNNGQPEQVTGQSQGVM